MASGRFHYGITPLPYNRPVRRSNSAVIEATALNTSSPLTPPTTSTSTQTRSIQSPSIQSPSVQSPATQTTATAATTSITQNDTKRECPICLEAETTTATTQSVLTKPCSHTFHLACIKEWINTAPPHPQNYQYVSCPMCRGPVKSIWDGQGRKEVLSGSRYPGPGGMGRIGDFGGRIPFPLIGGGSIEPFDLRRAIEGVQDIERRHREQEQRRRRRMREFENGHRLAALREAERFRASMTVGGREDLPSGLPPYPNRLASGPGNPPSHDNPGSLTETGGLNTPYSSPSYPRSSVNPGNLPNHYNYGRLGDPANPLPYGYLRCPVNQPLPNFHGPIMQPEDRSILPTRPIIDTAARRPIHEDESIRMPSMRTENLERSADMGLEVLMLEQGMRLPGAQLRLGSQGQGQGQVQAQQAQGQSQTGRSIGAEINWMGGTGGSERSLGSGLNAGSRIGNRIGRNIGGDITASTANETNSSPWGYTSRREPRPAPKCVCPVHRFAPPLEE